MRIAFIGPGLMGRGMIANLAAAMAACGWKVSGPGGAAERLGMKPSTLSSRLNILGTREKCASPKNSV